MDDWRLTNQKDYLFRRKLKRCAFSSFPQKDHEHCSFCWEKFGHGEDMLKIGYCTEDGENWVCDACYKDFKDSFEWQAE
jgi:hypothetical protein